MRCEMVASQSPMRFSQPSTRQSSRFASSRPWLSTRFWPKKPRYCAPARRSKKVSANTRAWSSSEAEGAARATKRSRCAAKSCAPRWAGAMSLARPDHMRPPVMKYSAASASNKSPAASAE
jgi:hypothetical protein